MSARGDYPKLNYETFGPHHQGGTSREAQAALDEIDRLRGLYESAKEQWILAEQENTRLHAEVQQMTDELGPGVTAAELRVLVAAYRTRKS